MKKSVKILRINRKKYKFLDYVFLAIITIIALIISYILTFQLIPLWTMKIRSRACNISTFTSSQPVRVEVITDFDRLCLSKPAFDKIITLTLKEKPDILIFFGRTGGNGKSQKKIASFFYLLERFQMRPERIFVVPDRRLYEYLLGSSSMLIYYVDFFKTFDAEVEFEGIEGIRDSLRFIMASSMDRIGYLKDTLKGTVIFLADKPKGLIIPELYIIKKKPDNLKTFSSRIYFVAQRGITFLNLY